MMNTQMGSLCFSSKDRRFQLLINTNNLERILALCKKSDGLETGGILVGHYTEGCNQAILTKVIDAPPDSQKGNNIFIRGIKGLKKLLDRLWSKNSYYLGEWHYHPFSSSKPSTNDIAQMITFSNAEKLHCPEPVLLIIGGNPGDKWEASAFVFPQNKKHLRLVLKDLPSSVRLEDGELIYAP